MTTKPSHWALDVWIQSIMAYGGAEVLKESPPENAAALVIEQARKAWEQELCEWLRRMERDDTNWPLHIARLIEDGEYRKEP